MERHAKEVEALLPHTKKMPPLNVGNSVRIQNNTGNALRRWDKSGQVIEVRQNDQYAIKVHGSGRVTLRNRQFLRLYVPHTEKPCPRRITDDIPNRPADIGRLPLSLFPTEDLTQTISTPLVSDAHRPSSQSRPSHSQSVNPMTRWSACLAILLRPTSIMRDADLSKCWGHLILNRVRTLAGFKNTFIRHINKQQNKWIVV